ncbi:hypothetical protein [Aliidiomarina sanyensis]|uniref:Uncharacterized protein n=1 Tax=Aliidiomarina sanyensis TaxID=1249555 RepID=A0A432WGI2_9GAMM|nr:hypothetical protein [Aliidiomarina sanyensis]RUO32888.1 hypothetical protein CWE11_07615 [Aliidiomarina sanyensis]
MNEIMNQQNFQALIMVGDQVVLTLKVPSTQSVFVVTETVLKELNKTEQATHACIYSPDGRITELKATDTWLVAHVKALNLR